LEFGVQSPGVIALSIRRVFVEPGCLPDALGEINHQSFNASYSCALSCLVDMSLVSSGARILSNVGNEQ
jgi:hypothetical protein